MQTDIWMPQLQAPDLHFIWPGRCQVPHIQTTTHLLQINLCSGVTVKVVILQVLMVDLSLIQAVSKLSYVVEPLHPFTEYIFRVVWIFTAQLQLYSPSSPSYRTHPYGGMACPYCL